MALTNLYVGKVGDFGDMKCLGEESIWSKWLQFRGWVYASVYSQALRSLKNKDF